MTSPTEVGVGQSRLRHTRSVATWASKRYPLETATLMLVVAPAMAESGERWDRPPRIGDSSGTDRAEGETTLSREEAAARLHAIADELASNNDVVIERDDLRFVAHVPDQVHVKVEFEIEDDGTELEIELTW
jgi:amphi-Trp domain-containing protein